MSSDLDPSWKRNFRRRLLAWFRHSARDLPWRTSRDPYRIWVSEIMLQQTQVATVKRYFERFIATFPTVEALANASEESVLRKWEGLGYYRRARQLHRAAQFVVRQHDGEFPRDMAQVQSLPGIGRYTAGAILSIAFDLRHPILEANTVRLFSRLIAYRGDTATSEGKKRLWAFAESILPRSGSGLVNEALIELGATLCTPRQPRCEDCPVAVMCPTRARGLQAKIPAPPRMTNYEDAHEACVVVWRKNKVLLRRCTDTERWAGLWDFPRFSLEAPRDTPRLHDQLMAGVHRLTGISIFPKERVTTIKHGVTRFRITLDCYNAQWRSGRSGRCAKKNLSWVVPNELANYPLSKTARRISQLIVQDRSVQERGIRQSN